MQMRLILAQGKLIHPMDSILESSHPIKGNLKEAKPQLTA
jgi:hypothetical protein